MPATAVNHFTVLTDDVDGSVAFYGEVLGLQAGPRPPFTFPGAWLYAGDQPVLHLVGGRAREQLRPGVIDHVAFSATGLRDTLARLAARGVEHTWRRLPGGEMWQVFFFDPNGARGELDYAGGEPGPA
jgi:catechol 2,3-dioxygenase-like lactoylglutathione lyase family enzyme